MPSNKPRLQLALYARPKHPGSYHYALFIAAKNLQGPVTKHHVKNTLQIDASGEATAPWRYERAVVTNIEAEHRLLVRVIIAKVATSWNDVEKILESAPGYQIDNLDRAETQSFSCSTWARDAYQELRRQGAVTAKSEKWEDVKRKAQEYVETKQQQRRWSSSWERGSGVPLMDLLNGKEIVE